MDDHVFAINVDRKLRRQLPIKENASSALQVPFGTMGGASLIIDRGALPSFPAGRLILVETFEMTAFAVKEDKEVIFKHRK